MVMLVVGGSGSGKSAWAEDLENLLANHLYAPGGRGLPGALEAVETLAAKGRHLVLVGNTIFSDGEGYPPATREYLALLARLQGRAAALADGAAEVVCGIPVWMKGKEEWFR